MKIIELLEAKNAPLYHTTRMIFLANILRDNILLGNSTQEINGKDIKGISTTRSLDFAKYWGRHLNAHKLEAFAILVLEQSKIANNYKIIPVDFYTTTAQNAPFTAASEKLKFRNFRRSSERAEAEEFILTRKLENLDRYLISVLLTKAGHGYLLQKKKAYIERFKRAPENKIEQELLKDIEFILNYPKLKII